MDEYGDILLFDDDDEGMEGFPELLYDHYPRNSRLIVRYGIYWMLLRLLYGTVVDSVSIFNNL